MFYFIEKKTFIVTNQITLELYYVTNISKKSPSQLLRSYEICNNLQWGQQPSEKVLTQNVRSLLLKAYPNLNGGYTC